MYSVTSYKKRIKLYYTLPSQCGFNGKCNNHDLFMLLFFFFFFVRIAASYLQESCAVLFCEDLLVFSSYINKTLCTVMC